MKVKAAADPPDWSSALELVETILVNVGLAPTEARQRVVLWRARQHHLEGQALETLFFRMDPSEHADQILRWALEGQAVEEDLRAGASALGIILDPDPPFS